MRLRTFLPPLPESILTSLEDIGIKTDADLLFSFTPIEIYQKLSPDSISLRELKDLIAQVTASSSAHVYRGDEFLAIETKRLEDRFGDDLQSGVVELDRLVDGFGKYEVLEISGGIGSGKTALALQIVLRHLSSNPDSSVLWIDTIGDLSSERIPPVLESFRNMACVDSALDRLQITLAFDIDTVQEVLETLRISLSSDPGQSPVRCIVIDSVTPLFRPLLSIVSSQGHAIMTTFMRQLRSLAQTFSLTILVLNATSVASPHNPASAFATTNRKPALGPSFTYMSDATLWLAKQPTAAVNKSEDRDNGRGNMEPTDGSTLHVAEILRSKLTVGFSVYVQLHDKRD